MNNMAVRADNKYNEGSASFLFQKYKAYVILTSLSEVYSTAPNPLRYSGSNWDSS
jgi:hypothetical protein